MGTAVQLLTKFHDNITTPPSLSGYLDAIAATAVITGSNFNFCHVTVQCAYTGSDGTIRAYIYTPLEKRNGHVLEIGSDGFRTKTNDSDMMANVENEYAAMVIDGGNWRTTKSSEPWALLGTGNINFELSNNYSGATWEDPTIIGKTITTELYRKAPMLCYWKGYSTNGRQGLMPAHRFSKLYNGMMAAGPAFSWANLMTATH